MHFQVGSEGRSGGRARRSWLRLVASPFALVAAILCRRAAIVHINTSLNAKAYWRDLATCWWRSCGARVVLYQVHGGRCRTLRRRPACSRACRARRCGCPTWSWCCRGRSSRPTARSSPGQHVVVLPNGIDCAPFLPCDRGAAGPPTSRCGSSTSARLAREKGLLETLQALRARARRGRATRASSIAGNGPEAGGLRALRDGCGIGARVSFAGPVFGEDKVSLLAEADVLVLPSYSEGLPYALLEAMAAGVVPIATRSARFPTW